MSHPYVVSFPFFTKAELDALTDDADLLDLTLSAPFTLGDEQFHLAHRIDVVLADLRRTARTSHVLHAEGEYALADENGDVCTVRMTGTQQAVVARAAAALATSEVNIVARVLSEVGFNLLYDNWEPVASRSSVPGATARIQGFQRYAPPFPFAPAE